MPLWIFLFISYIILPSNLPLTSYIHFFLLPIQSFCNSLFTDSTQPLLHSAFFCGESLHYGYIKRLFQQVGLYHILVISGFHLTQTQNFLKFLFPSLMKNYLFSSAFLIFYSLLSGWNPPVVRALFEHLFKFSKKNELNRILSSWLLCLIFFPNWILSFSLNLSLIARLSIFLFSNQNFFKLTLGIAFFLSPLLWMDNLVTQLLSQFLAWPLIFLLILGGFIEVIYVLFEYLIFNFLYFCNFEFLFILLSFLSSVCNEVLGWLLFLLDQARKIQSIPFSAKVTLTSSLQLIYCCFIYSVCHFFNVKRKRAVLKLQPRKKKKTSSIECLFLFLIIFFQPKPLAKNKYPLKFKTKGKVYIQDLNHEPLAHNKQSHHKHLNPSLKLGP